MQNLFILLTVIMSLTKKIKKNLFLCKLLHENTTFCLFLFLCRATNNLIHIWLAFPNLNYFGVCHFEKVENWRKKMGLLNTPPFFPYQQNGMKTSFSLFSQ